MIPAITPAPARKAIVRMSMWMEEFGFSVALAGLRRPFRLLGADFS
jgi:hypothetical protein